MNRKSDLRLCDLGEDAVVRRLARNLPSGDGVIAGIGDDCAVVRPLRRGWSELLKTDCVVEGIHFRPDAPRAAVGWKAAARVVSDFAAMGGTPRHALVTVCLPSDRPVSELDRLYAGIRKAAMRFRFGVVGGDLARSPGPMMVSIAMTGAVRRWVGRAGAKPGDGLYVTGCLGGSGAGRHLRFEPRLDEGIWLTGQRGVRAMMDLSDGLATDLPRLARASGCGFEVDVLRVPRGRGASAEAALCDGEDYELLIAVAPAAAERVERGWKERFPSLRLTRIGCLTAKGEHWLGRTGAGSGWDHFGGDQ